EMLDHAMDLEADLGIDSIKRVEILGTLQEQFPALPTLAPEDLAELRTLGQIADHLAHTNGSTGNGSAPAQPAPVAQSNGHAVPAPAPAAPAADYGAALLAVVSDKTGYPVEMLDHAMDLEADLGIDSIKRVEILGTLQEQFPALPTLAPEDLAELRTLGQIADHLAHTNGSTGNGSAPVSNGNGNGNGHSVAALPDLPTLERPITRSVVDLRSLPAPDRLDIPAPGQTVCVLTSDGTPLTGHVARMLQARGWKVVVLTFPTTLVSNGIALPAGVPQVALSGTSEAQIAQSLQTITAQHGQIGTFLHLHPASSTHTGSLFSEQEKALVQQVFLLAKHLKPALSSATRYGHGRFVTVARLDGAFGLDQQADFSAVGGGLFGLTKTLNLEWPAVFCRALDISASVDPTQTAGYIVAELYDPNRLLTEVGYGVHGRVTVQEIATV
ncbi:MAG: hypothetical protein HC876_20660, partial [Chloroflexaceae bacterium]|nr:hypothetical protein [Chloroflexaceae bacterium]